MTTETLMTGTSGLLGAPIGQPKADRERGGQGEAPCSDPSQPWAGRASQGLSLHVHLPFWRGPLLNRGLAHAAQGALQYCLIALRGCPSGPKWSLNWAGAEAETRLGKSKLPAWSAEWSWLGRGCEKVWGWEAPALLDLG